MNLIPNLNTNVGPPVHPPALMPVLGTMVLGNFGRIATPQSSHFAADKALEGMRSRQRDLAVTEPVFDGETAAVAIASTGMVAGTRCGIDSADAA